MSAPLDIDHLIVLDFEATCEEQKSGVRPHVNEIIEWPSVAVRVDGSGNDGEIEQFVRPKRDARVSAFCQRLTTITQAQVDGGIPFADAWKAHQRFLAAYPRSVLVTCGDWDLKTMLPRDVTANHMDGKYPAYYKHWIDIKVPFAKMYHMHKRPSMMDMLQRLDITPIGTHHRGIDDCRNIAQIVSRMLRDGWSPCQADVHHLIR